MISKLPQLSSPDVAEVRSEEQNEIIEVCRGGVAARRK